MIMCVLCHFFKVQLHTYWQSKGDTPHIITINVYVKILQFIVQFPKRVILSSIQLYTLYSTDSSYSPSLISILESQDGFHFQEYETFTMELNGKEMEFAIEEEFNVAGKKYIVASQVEGDEIKEDGCYIFASREEDGESVIEKIMDAKEYEKVTNAYLKMQG